MLYYNKIQIQQKTIFNIGGDNMVKKHSHIIVVGIDGAGSFIKDADTPNFDRIFANGAVTYNALSSNPAISAECWGSILLGVGP